MKTVLVVDDSATTRSLIKSVIELMEEISIIEASTGFEALRLLPQHVFDLVITDINMPDINGYELINFIKNHDKYKKIPIIFVSTERGEKDIEKGLSLGAVDYLTKPFKSEELQSIIRNTLNL